MGRWIKKTFGLLFRSTGPDSFDIFESEIEGEFHGWSGNTLFALSNGQVWQQSSNGLARCYARSPKVLIYRSGPAIKMYVKGVDHTICVKRVR
jgi:hypothetical protein